MDFQEAPNSQKQIERGKVGGFPFSYFKTYYKVKVFKTMWY